MSALNNRINQKVCFIGGTGHSGSTLLGILLGNHSQSFFCGEGNKSQYIDQENAPSRKRFCKFCGPNCPIWGNLDLNSERDLYEHLAQRIHQVFSTRKTLMIDSTSKADWIRQQSSRLQQEGVSCSFIFLQRDGRAVVNSYRRKYPNRPLEEIIQSWIAKIEAAQQLFNDFSGPKTILHYEELASNPSKVLPLLCSFLDISYEPQILNPINPEYHLLGGNNGTQFWATRHQGQSDPKFLKNMSEVNRHYYQHHQHKISLDLRWKQELSPEQQALFDRLASSINQPFQWDI